MNLGNEKRTKKKKRWMIKIDSRRIGGILSRLRTLKVFAGNRNLRENGTLSPS